MVLGTTDPSYMYNNMGSISIVCSILYAERSLKMKSDEYLV